MDASGCLVVGALEPGELRRVEIAGPVGQPVRDGERSDRLSSEFGKQSAALDLVGPYCVPVRELYGDRGPSTVLYSSGCR